MQSFHWSRGIVFIALLAIFTGSGAVSAQDHFMVPDRFATQLPADSEVLHEYGQRLLVRIPEGSRGAIDQRYASRLEDTRYLSYRAWRGRAGGNDPADLPDLGDAYFIMALIGPLDSQWRRQIESHGLTVVDHVNPYGLLVRGGSDAVQSAAASLRTSRDYPVITHALTLPESSRFGSDVAEWLRGRSEPGDIGFRTDNGEPLIRVVFHEDIDFSEGHSLVSDFLEPGPEFVSGGPSGQYRASASDLATLLEQVPEVAYVHGVYPKELHNNIGAQEHITNIEPVWTDLGYIGTGLIAGINDSGVDEEHADFPAGTIVATQGAMSGTDNGHGTHVSGTVAGRGAAPSPTNTSGCGDVTPPLPDARGMAHGSQIVHNNLFDGGIGDEAAMMEWQFQQGAVINNNSWGYSGFGGPATDYGAETVAVDAAVREAEAGVDSQIAIVFSAGNSAAAGISKPGNGKNVITVGASQNDRCGSYIPSQCAGPDIDGMACFSSQGPSQGRNKPDIVAPGTDVLSTGSSDPEATWGGWDQAWTGEEYAIVPGTSMSAPMVTGAATVFMEAYQDLNGGLPSPALVKAALINTATDIGMGFPSNIQGWGRLNLRKAIEGPVEDGIAFFDQDEVDHLSTGESWTTEIGIASADEPVRFSLVWTDPPGSAGCDPCHINDLDLIVTAPDGTVYRGNQFSGAWSEPDASGRDDGNNVENVYVEAPVSGDWQVEIDGFNVAENPGDLDGQDFALVATGDIGGFAIDPASAEVCTADGSTDFTITLSSQFETTTDLAASGLPSGTTGSFDPNPVIFPDTQSLFTVSDLGLASGGDYTIDITATDAGDPSNTAESSLNLTLFEAVPGQVSLLTPSDGATDLDLRPEFTWSEPSEPSGYQIQVATDSGFTSIVIDETVEGAEFTPDADLATGTDYFWRVRSNNACGDGAWSTAFTFQTRFEPVADISPNQFEYLIEVGNNVTQPLFIGNTGTGNLVWSIDTDQVDTAAVSREFDGYFDIANWTLENDPAGVNGSFDTEPGPPVELFVIGGNDGTGGVTDFFIEIPSDGEISFDWGFQSNDSLGCFDSGGYVVNDTFTELACNNSEVGFFEESATVEVSQGDIFAFRAATQDGGFGAGTFGVTNFEFEAEACVEPTAVPWLSVNPASGSTAGGTTDQVDVTVDATGLSTGAHSAFLCVTSNDTAGPELVGIPVDIDVVDPGVGVLEGEVTSTGYCNDDPHAVAGADVVVTGQTDVFTTTTEADGSYRIEIHQDESPVDITVSADGYLNATSTGVTISGGTLTVEDFDAPVNAPCATIAPESFSFDVLLGDTDSDLLTLGNVDGNIDLEWSVDHFEEAGGSSAQNERAIILEEDFEGTFPPADWTTVDNTGDCPWLTSDDYDMSSWGGTARGAAIDSDTCGSGTTADAELITPSMDLTSFSQTELTFDFAHRELGSQVTLDVSTDGGGSWTNLETWDADFAYPGDVSLPVEVDLSDYDGESDVQLRWHYTSGWAWWAFVDNVVIEEGPPPPPSCENPTDVTWLSMTPESGITAPGTSEDVTVSVDSTGLADGVYEATLCVSTNDANVAETEIPVELAVTDPALGTLEGTVTTDDCGLDPDPLADALITIVGQLDSYTITTDSDGFYSIKIHEDESPVDVTASHDDYVQETQAGLPITGLNTTVADFTLTLDAPCIDTNPDSLSTIVDLGQTVDATVDISNFGTQSLDWLVEVEPEGSVARELADIAAENGGNARNPEAAPHPTAEEEAAGIEAAPRSLKPGEPWVTGQVRHQLLQEGVVLIPQSTNNRIMAFDPETGDLIDADFITYTESLGTLQHVLPHPDGERLLVVSQSDAVYQFDLDGNFLGIFAPAGGIDTGIMDNTRGMAFHPDTGNMLVTSSSGGNSNSVVEFDLDGNFLDVFVESGSGGLSGPWSIQFRDDDVLVSASGGNIYRYDHAGAFLDIWNDEIGFTEQIKQIESGNVLAAEFSSSGVWEFDPDGNQIDIYGPETFVRGAHELPDGNILTTNSGGVHEIDRAGNLVETKISGSSHQISFVQTLDCTAPDWVSFDPLTGTVNAGDPPDTLTVTFDPSGLAPGDYEGNFCVQSNDPVQPTVQVPVSMTAELPADWGTIEGTVQGLGYCNDDPGTLANATVEIVGASSTEVIEVDENGFFQTFLPESESPLEFTVSAPNHQGATSTVNFSGGDVVVENFDLLLDEPCATALPEDITVNMDPDETLTGALELGNANGNATLNWSIDTAMPTDLRDSTPPAGDASTGGDSTAGLSLSEVLGESLESRNVIQPAQDAVDCEGAPGLIVHDDGSVENGYSGNPDVVSEVAFVDHFVPSNYPATLNAACVSFLRASGGPDSLDFEIVVFADDGPGGAPGTELGALDATVSGIPVFPNEDPVWASYDISSLGVAIAEGGAYIGVRYAPTDPGVFISADQSTGNPVGFAGGHWWNDSAGEWAPIDDVFADYRALFVRAVEGVIDCSDPVGVPWLGADPAFGIVHAGNTREVDINFDTSGLSPGTYEAGLCIFSNDPVNEVLTVPVTLNVRIPTDWATIEGTVESLGYCEENPAALEGATVEAVGVADTYTAQTDASGAYEIFLPADEAPVDVTASHADHVADTEAGVGLSEGTTVEVNFGLVEEAGCTSNDPDSYDVTLVTGNSTSEMLTLMNAGAGDANFDITSAEIIESLSIELERDARLSDGTTREGVRSAEPVDLPATSRMVDIQRMAREASVLLVTPDDDISDLEAALSAFPDLTVTTFTGDLSAITGGDLEPYDVVMTTNNTQWAAASADVSVGNALADYIDAGGKVIVNEFVYDWDAWALAGRFIDEDYGPFTGTSSDNTGSSSLGTVHLPDHPIMDGVGTVTNSYLWQNPTVAADADHIADWDDGTVFVAANEHSVAFNVLPSDGSGVAGWSGDLDLMYYNAINFLVGPDLGEPAPWLSFDPETGSVGAGDSTDVSVTFDADGLDAGTYEADILVNLDEGGEDGTTLSIPATMQVLDPAVIDVDPTSLSSVLEEGGTDLQSFNIANGGEATLDWSIDDTTVGCELPGWASVDPLSGSLETGNGEDVDVTFDATGLDAGVYDATVCVDSNDPGNPVVEVDLQLTVDETLATVEGTVMSLGYCSENPSAAAGAGILIEGQSGNYSGTADGSGFYQIDVPADESPVDVSASHGGHITDIVTGVALTAGEVSTVDIDLVLEAPCASVSPSMLSFTTVIDGDESDSLSIDNSGGGASLSWTLETGGDGCYEPATDTWLTLSSSGDTVGAGSSQAVDVTADATGLEPGQYTTEVCLGTNDGEAGEFGVPVELNVLGEAIFQDRFEGEETN